MQILQCYSTHEEELLKQILEAQKEAADPLDKVLQIFDAKVIVSLKFAKLGRELYVCALHYYDENLFDDTTPLYVKVKEALDECVKKKLYSFNEDTRNPALLAGEFPEAQSGDCQNAGRGIYPYVGTLPGFLRSDI